jgi:hypothetical protein
MQMIFHEDADEKPWLRGNLKKKDGDFGTSIRGIGNEWELCPDSFPLRAGRGREGAFNEHGVD